MENLFVLLVLASFVLLVIGFFSPKTSLFWQKENQSKKKSAKIYGITLIVSLFLLGVSVDKSKENKNTGSSQEKTTSEGEATTSHPTVGQVLKTRYFEVTINHVNINGTLNTGNEFTDVEAGNGNMFLILNTTFKNIDDESRMLTDGSVFINYNGKEYEFDHSETIMAEGFGLFLDQINPLTSKTTNLVYKLPTEISGPAYYRPGRADDDQKIFLGDIK